MKKQITHTLFAFIVTVIGIGLIGCSSDNTKTETNDVIAEVLQPVTDAVAEEIADVVVASPDETDSEATFVSEDSSQDENLQRFSDLVYHNGNVYAVANNALIVYNVKSKKEIKHAIEDELNTVVFHDGSIYAGGDQLYKLNDTILEFVDDAYDGSIIELYSYGYQLMIGTTDGLYRRGIFGNDKLMDDITVSAITEDNSGLWIGSLGEGLYRWDGEIFKKRFLSRDTSLFDNVNAIDFKHDHLYVGCDNGMYVYDGGRWTTLTTEDGLPDNNIRSIDASDWTVYVATNKGVVGYFEEEFSPVNKLENIQVNALKVRGRKLMAATEYEGIIEKNGNLRKTLIQPVEFENIQILSLIP